MNKVDGTKIATFVIQPRRGTFVSASGVCVFLRDLLATKEVVKTKKDAWGASPSLMLPWAEQEPCNDQG